ncbi:unnamed protein product [marine sediment metagenome]|uniref:Uncharacterized protein n=1 Tax=marine sediment metagenome TaxID=412755 RepID=X1L2A2_9ZZZZ
MRTELELKEVTFKFADGTQRVLTGDELSVWETLCSLKSDFLLPGNSSHVLGSIYEGLIQGFFPPEALDSCGKKLKLGWFSEDEGPPPRRLLSYKGG